MARRRKPTLQFAKAYRSGVAGSVHRDPRVVKPRAGTYVARVTTRRDTKRATWAQGGLRIGELASFTWRPNLHPRGKGGRFIKKGR